MRIIEQPVTIVADSFLYLRTNSFDFKSQMRFELFNLQTCVFLSILQTYKKKPR